MAKAELMVPISMVHGKIDKQSRVYLRELNGKQIVQTWTRHADYCPTEAEQANRKAFGLRFGTLRKKKPNTETQRAPLSGAL